MAKRAELFIELSTRFEELIEGISRALSEAHISNPTDSSLIDLFLHEKEFDPERDIEQLSALCERNNIASGTIGILFDHFRKALHDAQRAMKDCPFNEATLTPTSITGRGDDDQDIMLDFDKENIAINVDLPHHEDETDDDTIFQQERYRRETEEWLLEEI